MAWTHRGNPTHPPAQDCFIRVPLTPALSLQGLRTRQFGKWDGRGRASSPPGTCAAHGGIWPSGPTHPPATQDPSEEGMGGGDSPPRRGGRRPGWVATPAAGSGPLPRLRKSVVSSALQGRGSKTAAPAPPPLRSQLPAREGGVGALRPSGCRPTAPCSRETSRGCCR